MASMQRGGHMGGFKGKRDSSELDKKFLFRFLIPVKAAIIIIGKSGERIQRLRNECNSRLSIPDSKGPERVFIVDGPFDNCIKMWTECFHDLKDVMGSKGGEEMDLRFLCHNSIVGAIIGKGGTRVKELRSTYQLGIIKVHVELAPMSSDRVIQIVGAPDKIFGCLKVMFAELEKQNIRGPVDNYNPDNFDELLSPTYGGWRGEPGWQHALSGVMGDGMKSHDESPMGYDGGGYNTAPSDAARHGPMNPYGSGRGAAQSGQMDKYDVGRGQYGQYESTTMNQYGSGRATDQYDAEDHQYDQGRGVDQPPVSTPQATIGQYGPSGGPPMNQYGSVRGAGQMNQYGSGRGAGQMDQYGSGRGGGQMDQYGSGRGAGQMDQYGSGRGGGQMDQYGSGRGGGQMDQYGSGRGGGQMDQYGAGRGQINQYGSSRGGGPMATGQVDQYGSANRSASASIDEYEDGTSMNSYGSMARDPGSEEYGSGRNQYGGGVTGVSGGRGGARGGGRNVVDSAGRTIVPLMDQCNYQEDFHQQGNTRAPPAGARRPFQDERSSRPGGVGIPVAAKKSRPWGPSNDDNDDDDSVAGSGAGGGQNSVDVTIPSLYLAALQGLQGEKLSNMMKDSGADIVVLPLGGDNASRSGHRVLSVRGTKDQIEGAQYLMQMCMKRCMLNLTHG